MILLSKVFRRLLHSFDAIFRWETSNAQQRKSQKWISRHSACLFTFYQRKYFFAYGRRSNVFHYCFKSAKWVGNFVVCSLEVILKIISLRRPFGLPVWNFGCPRAPLVTGLLLGSSLDYVKVLLKRFHLNGNTREFCP